MNFNDFISKKYGYKIKTIVERYKSNIEYRDILGVNCGSSRLVLSYEKQSPFNRCSTYFLAEKNDQIDFCRANYFVIENGETGDMYLSDRMDVLISNVNEIVYKHTLDGRVRNAVFSATDDGYNYFLLGYNFSTQAHYDFNTNDRFVSSYGNKVLLLGADGLTLYDFMDTGNIILKKNRVVYSENKPIRNCERIENRIDDGWRYLIDPLNVHALILEYEDEKESVLLLDNNFLTLALSDYYVYLKYIKSYIYPPLVDSDDDVPFPDTGFTFEYMNSEEEGEMYIDNKYKIHTKTKKLRNTEGCDGELPFEI